MRQLSLEHGRGKMRLRKTPSLSLHALLRLLIIASIALMPFQNLGFAVTTTKIDWSNIIFSLISILSLPMMVKKGYDSRFLSFMFLYLFIQLFMFFLGPTSVLRFAAAFMWLTSAFLIYGARKNIFINSRVVAFFLYLSTFVVASSVHYQYFVDGVHRPYSTMSEPSVAGLVVLAGAAGCLVSSHFTKNQYLKFFLISLFVFYISAGYLTKSMHILTFLVSITVVSILARIVRPTHTVLLSLLIYAVYWLVVSDTHYLSRIDVENAADNLSTLSWLRGFDQMIASMTAYPLTGVGVGGTGQFDFLSVHGQLLDEFGIGDLNLLDSYSGFFRLTIELGPILMFFVLMAMARRLGELWKASRDGHLSPSAEVQSRMFLFTFAVCTSSGIMLKEPTYSLSQFAVAVLLFALVPLRLEPSRPDRRLQP